MRAVVATFLCLFIAQDELAVGAQSDVEIFKIDKPNDIIILGNVEEKTYIGDADGTLRNWTEAHSFCENRGLSLAAITTESQAEFLKLAYDPLRFNGWYWVDAKDGGEENPKLFWTKTNSSVQEFDNLELRLWSHEEKAGNCLCYSSNNQENAYFFKHGCFHVHHVLCETYKPVESFPNAKVVNKEKDSVIVELGTVGDKTYYGDHILRNYDDSRAHCESQGMKLATVNTNVQSRFLKSASTKINYDGWFWIAERPKRTSDEEDNRCPCYSPHNLLRFRRSCNHEHFTLCESWKQAPSSLKLSGSSNIKMPQSDIHSDLSELFTEVNLNESGDDDEREEDMNDIEGNRLTDKDLFIKSILHLLHRQLLEYDEKTDATFDSQEEHTTITPEI